jgi:hypothetical protein
MTFIAQSLDDQIAKRMMSRPACLPFGGVFAPDDTPWLGRPTPAWCASP